MNNLRCILLLFFFSMVVNSCKKELIPNEILPESQNFGFKTFDWSPSEKRFFSLNETDPKAAQARLEQNKIYHPLLIEAYNQLAEENEQHAFLDAIINKSGLPVWSKSIVYKNPQSNIEVVTIPLRYESLGRTSGFISLIKENANTGSKFKISGISRQSLLDTLYGDTWQKLVNTRMLLAFDKVLYNSADEDLKNAYCGYKFKAKDLPKPVNGARVDPKLPPPAGGCKPSDEECQWKFVEACSNTGQQVFWFGGMDNIPPHLDHDHDGIPNWDDQDFVELGISQYDFEHQVWDWWELNYELDLGDYDLFWDFDFVDPVGGQEIDFTALIDLWQQFLEWGNQEFEDDLYYDPNDGINCPWEDPLTGGSDDRDPTVCAWYYVYDCSDAGYVPTTWWDDFEMVVPCPSCPDYLYYQDMYVERLMAHSSSTYDLIEFWNLYNASLEWGCDPYSPCFEDCIDENMGDFLDEVVIEVTEGEPVISTINPICPDMFDFRPNAPGANVTRRTAGLKNLIIELNLATGPRKFLFPYTYFASEAVPVICPETLSKKAADAINAAIFLATDRINSNNLAIITYCGTCAPEVILSHRIRRTLVSEIRKAFEIEVAQCAAQGIGLSPDIKYPNSNQADDYSINEMTIFVNMSTFDDTCQ